MAIWEKVVVNLETGSKKIAAAASIFAERVRVELSIVRLRIRLDEVQSRIDELHRSIGRRVVDLIDRSAIPKAGEQLAKDEDIATALSELEARNKDLEELKAEMKSEQSAYKNMPEGEEETVV
jgi:hypothetical protein